MPAFITIDEFKSLPLGIKNSIMEKVGDPQLQTFIETASVQVENYCNRKLAEAQHTQTVEGTDANIVILREYPVSTVDSVTWDDGSATGTISPSDLRVSDSGVVRFKSPNKSGYFMSGRYYSFTYTAGYSTIPFPIKHATGLWVTELLQPTFAGAQRESPEIVALSSEQIGELLEEYRRKGIR